MKCGEKNKRKGKGAIVFVGLSVLVLLVFLAGWLTVGMIDLSDGLDQVTKTGKPETAPPAETAKNTPQVVKKKIPGPPTPPPPPVSVKETVVTAQTEAPSPKETPQQETSEKIEEKPIQEPEKISNSNQSTLKPAEIQSTQPKDDTPPPVETSSAAPVTPSEQITKIERYAIQVGAFRVKAFADERIYILKSMDFKPFIFSTADSKGSMWYTVRVGRFQTLENTNEALSIFHKKTEFPTAVMHVNSLVPASKKE